jgi:hypothetical protein
MPSKDVIVTNSGVFIPFGNPLIALIESSEPARKCSKCGVLTANSELTGSICDDCAVIKPVMHARTVVQRLRSYRAA